MVNEDVDGLMDRPWPVGRAGGRQRNPGSVPLELTPPLWYEERWFFGPLPWRLPRIALLMFVGGLVYDRIAGLQLGVVGVGLVTLFIVGVVLSVSFMPRARGLKQIRVGAEGMVIGRWEVPASQIREVWVLPPGDGGVVSRARAAAGVPVSVVNFNPRYASDWKRVQAVLVRWHDVPRGRPTRIPGRVRDRVLLVATRDAERLAGALTRFPNAHRAAGLPELETR